jgi:NADH dehydrogenase FAD-containing subunit
MTTKKILILGGGYAGLMAAIRLAGKTKRLKPQITLVNGLPYFVERLLLHEQAAGKALKQEPIESMLRGTGVRFVQGWVSGLNPTEQTVQVRTVAGEQTLPYDYLINALGSRVNRAAVPGVDRYAFSLDSVGDLTTMALGEKLKQAQPGWRVIVVGGGATGIEAAAEIKVRLPQSEVAMVTRGDVGAFKGPEVQRHLQAALREQAIMLHEHQTVRQVDAEGVMLANGRLPADVVLWAGGFVASSLGREAGLQVNGRDQILVDPYLRTLSHPTISGVGDAAWPVETPGAPVRMSLFTALLMGAHVADNIAALLKGRAMKPFSFAW